MALFATIMGAFGFALAMTGLCIAVYRKRESRVPDFLLLGFLCLVFAVLGILSSIS